MRIFTLLLSALLALTAVCASQDPTAAARKRVAADPRSAQGYLELALALCREARDSSDSEAYNQANAAVDRALELSPGNHEALKVRIMVMLGRHDFAAALAQASELNRKVRDDISVWGYLSDAHVGLGDYAEAVKDAQWILDLRRGSALGFTKAAALREIYGDLEGAGQYYDEALLRTSQNDVQERAWLMTQNARLQLTLGNPKRAGEMLAKALALNPASQFTLANLARVRASEGNYPEAVSLCRQRLKSAPRAGSLYDLAVMLEKSGQAAEAETTFREFETKARAETANPLNANRDLVFYYADQRNSPAKALAIAAKEAETRHDSDTLDAYAWALYRSGKFDDAQTQMDRALATGVRDGIYFCHALQIATALQDSAAVTRLEKELSGMPACECAALRQYSK
jgi:tetratricopeptide (TPR) repeat protein